MTSHGVFKTGNDTTKTLNDTTKTVNDITQNIIDTTKTKRHHLNLNITTKIVNGTRYLDLLRVVTFHLKLHKYG